MELEFLVLALGGLNTALLVAVYYRQGNHVARIRGLEARIKRLEAFIHREAGHSGA